MLYPINHLLQFMHVYVQTFNKVLVQVLTISFMWSKSSFFTSMCHITNIWQPYGPFHAHEEIGQ